MQSSLNQHIIISQIPKFKALTIKTKENSITRKSPQKMRKKVSFTDRTTKEIEIEADSSAKFLT